MKIKLLALGFSLASLLGSAAHGVAEKDQLGPILTLELFVVYPHLVKPLNDQKLSPIDFDRIIRSDVEETIEEIRRAQTHNLIAFEKKVIQDVPLVASTMK